jgi:L-amino acid N-acyltransferase YncA
MRDNQQVAWILTADTCFEIPGMDFTIDEMRPHDWESVRAIYLAGLASGDSSFETQAPSWDHWHTAHHGHSRLVARQGNRVIGWAALAPVSARRCYAGVAEVSVYVADAARAHGVGKQLLQAVIASAEHHGIWTLQGATFPENTASIRLQLACGFRIVGRRERIAQHQGRWRDTILTERRSAVVGAESDMGCS